MPASASASSRASSISQPAPAALTASGVGPLMIVGGEPEGHEQGRPAERQQLGDAGCAGARDDEVAHGHALREIVEEARELGREAEGGVGARHPLQVLRPALLRERDPPSLVLGEAGDRRGHDLAQHPRTLAAADHQHRERLVRACGPIRRAAQGRDLGPDRIAGDDAPGRGHALGAAGGLEGQGEPGGAARDQPIGATQHRVLLVDQERQAQQGGGEAEGRRGVAAERRDRGRPRPAQDRHALPEAHGQAPEAGDAAAPRSRGARRLDQPMRGLGGT